MRAPIALTPVAVEDSEDSERDSRTGTSHEEDAELDRVLQPFGKGCNLDRVRDLRHRKPWPGPRFCLHDRVAGPIIHTRICRLTSR